VSDVSVHQALIRAKVRLAGCGAALAQPGAGTVIQTGAGYALRVTKAFLRVDITCALDRTLGAGRGIELAALESLGGALDALPAWAAGERAAGRLAFLDVAFDQGPADAVSAWCEQRPAADDVVVAGIGGSALGARVFDALRRPWGAGPRLHVLDTVDPDLVEALLGRIEPSATLLLGVSRSGATLETNATFRIFEDHLVTELGTDAAAGRIAVVSGAEPNALGAHAARRGYGVFTIPPGVGGRYSALTPAGLLAAACAGVSPHELLAGAAAAGARCLEPRLADNPALALAAVHRAAEVAGRAVAVLMPYGERLRPLGPWWAQLVGESLGKGAADGPEGVTPVAAVGPADQHSLLQLLVEGPDDKLVVFVDAPGSAGPVVPAGDGPAAGRALGAILAAEREGTQYALAETGRPSVRVELAASDAASVGAFLLTYEMAVVYWARLLGVDPFGQPGVELGKRAARARLTGDPAPLARRMDDLRDRPPTVSA
jgi:glucose-6-phosphate isomerase